MNSRRFPAQRHTIRFFGLGLTVLWLALTVVPSTVRAQSADIDQLWQEAIREYAAERWPEARALAERVYSRRPSGAALGMMGSASYNLREYLLAVGYFRRALAESSQPLSGAHRARAQADLDRALVYLCVITLRVSPASAVVRIVGDSTARHSGDRVEVEAGSYRVVATAPEHQIAEVAVTLRAGETREVELSLEPVRTAQPSLPVVAPEVVARAETPPPSPSAADAPVSDATGSGAGVALTTMGGVLIAGGVGSSIWWRGRNDAVSDCSECENQSQLRRQRAAAAGVAIGTLVTGVGLLAVGAVTLASRPDDAAGVALQLRLRGPSLSLSGSF